VKGLWGWGTTKGGRGRGIYLNDGAKGPLRGISRIFTNTGLKGKKILIVILQVA